MDNLIILSIGKDFHLRQGKDHILYAGMPSDNAYSIVQKKTQATRDMDGTYFIPKGSRI